MMLKKYKTFEEAKKDLWQMKMDDKQLSKLRKLFDVVGRLSPQKVKRGLQKFRTIEEANGNGETNTLSVTSNE